MAQFEVGGPDLAIARSVASLAALNDATPWVEMTGPFLMLATGGVGNVSLELSVDGGANAIACQLPNGAPNSWAIPVNQMVPSLPNERGLLFRLRCSAFTSGPINARLSRGPSL